MTIDTSTAREAARGDDGRFGAQQRSEALVPDLMAAAERLRRDLDDELHQMGVVSERVRAKMDEALRKHERRVFEVLNGHDRAAVDGRGASVLESQGYRHVEAVAGSIDDGPDPHLELSPRLVDDTTSALIAWRGRDKSHTTSRWLGGRLQLVADRISKHVRDDRTTMMRLNRSQRARLGLIDAALADARGAGDDHEYYSERLAQVLSVFAPRL